MSDAVVVKISKAGTNINSNKIDDYILNSRYQTLSLLYKVSVAFTVTPTNCTGSTTLYTHNLTFMPLTLAFTKLESATQRSSLPVNQFSDYTAGSPDALFESFNIRITSSTIILDYYVQKTVIGVGDEPIDRTINYTFDLYLFMFKLGSAIIVV